MKHFRIIIVLVAINTALIVNSQVHNYDAAPRNYDAAHQDSLLARQSLNSLDSALAAPRNCQLSIVNCQLNALLDSIDHNNTTLIALRKEAEARKLENRTDITLTDPEVGLKRMWEGAEQTGNLTEFTVGQSFDLPTVLGKRKGVAVQKNQLVDEEYRAQRMGILLEAELVCIDITYYNALAAELDRRLGHARRVVEVEKRRLDSGDTDVLSYNNVVLSLSALEAEKARVEMERGVLMTRLAHLNGGRPLGFDAQEYAPATLTDDFESWYQEALQRSPDMALAREEREVRRSELFLSKTMHLPTLSATYINERHRTGERSQGFTVGMNLPLWANKNRVRSARTALSAAEAREADAELQLRSQLLEGYERVRGLQHTADLYRRALAEANNSEMLARAMDEGFISVLEYLQGIELYYDYLDRSLNADRDYRRALAELEAWRL